MLQASTLIIGAALWFAGTSLRQRRDFRPWISFTISAVGGYATLIGLALCFRAGLTA